jgi:type II secretory pathway component GspD/PulD (secretin)
MTINGLLHPVDWVRSSGPKNQSSTGSSGSNCQIVDQQMIVRATASQHDQIASLISHYIADGRRQISFEIRTVRTAMELTNLFPQTGGQIYNSMSISHPMGSQGSIQFDSITTKASNQSLQSPLPVFVSILSPDAAKYCLNQAQRDQRANVLFAPKVMTFDGICAMVSDERSRPFVTGFLSSNSGLEPKITTVQDGFQLQATGQAITDKVHLNVAFMISNILNVRTRKFRSESGEFQLQVPEQQESVFHTRVILNDGHTLVMVPLERDSQGLLTLLLITPRIIGE